MAPMGSIDLPIYTRVGDDGDEILLGTLTVDAEAESVGGDSDSVILNAVARVARAFGGA